jgi:hypothetical protein
MAAPANLRGWGQGWPVDRSDDMRWVRAYKSGAKFFVHREIAPIVQHIINEMERRGYLIDNGPGDTDDDWSYNNRPIRGTRIPSNHSWGLAVDIDAQTYPWGSKKRLPQWVVDIWIKHGFEYGGDWYGGKLDPMHFEFAGWPSDARRIAALIGSVSTPERLPTPEDDVYIRDSKSGAIYAISATHYQHLSPAQWADRAREGAKATDMPPEMVFHFCKSRVRVG